MRKNLQVIRNNIAEEVYDTSTSMLNLITNYINIKYKDILRRVNFNQYNYDYTITTVAGQKDYALPSDFGKCIGAHDVTNATELAELTSIENIYRNAPGDVNTQGNATQYVIFNSAVMVQPSSSAVVTAVSDNATDTTQKVIIRGISGNTEITQEISLTGITSVDSASSFTRIKGISKDGNTSGNITVTCGATTLAVMAPKELVSRYKIVRLWKTPNSSLTINFPYQIKALPLIEDTDYPLIDVDDIIEIGARALAHSYQRREATATKYESMYEAMLANYIWDKENNPNRVIQFRPEPVSRETV